MGTSPRRRRFPRWSLLVRTAALLGLMVGLRLAGIAARGDEGAGWNVLIYGFGGLIVISFMLGFLDGRYRTSASQDATWFLAAAAAALVTAPFWALTSVEGGGTAADVIAGLAITSFLLAAITSLPAVFGVALGGATHTPNS